MARQGSWSLVAVALVTALSWSGCSDRFGIAGCMGTHTCVGPMHEAGAPSSGADGEGGVADVDLVGGASGAPVESSAGGEGGNASQGGAHAGEGPVSGEGGAVAGTSNDAIGGEAPLPEDREFAQWPMPNPVGSGYPHPAQYDTSKPNITIDRVTGLMWESNAGNEDYKWAEAAAKCKEATTGGYRDWRLPSRIELLSLIDFTRWKPAINVAAFPETQSAEYWTASLGIATPNTYYVVDFELNYPYMSASGELHFARCVRGLPEASPPHYSPHTGYVRDNATGLNWEMPAPKDDTDYASAVARCQALSAGGIEDWRLPSINELQTLVDVTKYQPALDPTAFTDVDAEVGLFWSSSSDVFKPEANLHWLLQDDAGVTPARDAEATNRSRCVFP